MPFVSDDRLRWLLEAEQMYEKMSAAHDLIFQKCLENPNPILPDFAQIGEFKFDAVVDLAREYKRLKEAHDNRSKHDEPYDTRRTIYEGLPRTRPVPEPEPSDASGGRTAD